MEQLIDMKCVACRSGDLRLSTAEITELSTQTPGWNIVEENDLKQLERAFRFKNFAQALAFTNLVGRLAEEDQHHPQIITEWGKVIVRWWTHAVGGLHRNDFIMAAKTSREFDQVTRV